MTIPMRLPKWREVKRRPVLGSSPDDRILHGPDCNRPKRAYADPFPATLLPQPAPIVDIGDVRFSGITESIAPMGSQNQKQNHLNLGAVCRLPLVGTQAPVRERDGRSASCSSSAMSSGRLFLDRVARQHCPSPLHRHAQTTTHPHPAWRKPDISTLQRIGHFYFALTAGRLVHGI